MAAAIIPLVASAVSALAPLLPSIIGAVEAAFRQPGQGPVKFDVVLNAVRAIASQLSTAGVIKGNVSDEQLATLIQSVFEQMDSTGEVNKPQNPIAPPAQKPPAAAQPVQAGLVPVVFTGFMQVQGGQG